MLYVYIYIACIYASIIKWYIKYKEQKMYFMFTFKILS